MSNPYAAPSDTNSDIDLPQIIAPNVRTLQIVTGALVQGAIVFGVIALFVGGFDADAQPTMLSYIGIGAGVFTLAMHFIVPPFVQNVQLNALRDDSFRSLSLSEKAGRVFPVLQTTHIIACALLEGGAFMNLVMFLIDSWVGNLLAAVVLIAFILLKFPTTTNMSFRIQNLVQEI